VETANRAVLVVRDSTGSVVSREEIPVTSDPYTWLGGDATGDPLPEGKYTLSLESWRDGEVIQEDPVEYYGRVIEARGGAGGVRLVFAGGIEVAATSITALRVPPD
jgi:flagellar basal-body rod modification protein FlgD